MLLLYGGGSQTGGGRMMIDKIGPRWYTPKDTTTIEEIFRVVSILTVVAGCVIIGTVQYGIFKLFEWLDEG